MAQELTRRRFAATAAALAGATVVAGSSARLAGAASSRIGNPAVIRAQNAPVEVVFHHIWGTPAGEKEPEKKNAAMQLIDAFNASQSDVKLISRTDTGDYYQNLQKTQAELAAGNPPDLVAVPWAFVDWATKGLVDWTTDV